MSGTSQRITCERCGRTLVDVAGNFWTRHNHKTGEMEKVPICKDCLTHGIENDKPNTFMWVLELFDVPFVKSVWVEICRKKYKQDPLKYGSKSVMGTYIRTMNMNLKWSKFGFADTKVIIEQEKKEEQRRQVILAQNKKMSENAAAVILDNKINNGIEPIEGVPEKLTGAPKAYEFTNRQSEEQYKFNMSTSDDQISQLPDDESNDVMDDLKEIKGVPVSPLSEIVNTQLGTVDGQPNVLRPIDESKFLDQLEEKDIEYLSLKWGNNFMPSEWIKLEEMYQKYANEYELNIDREETLKQICKTSLKMDMAMDIGDIDQYSKLAKVQDALRRSAKFTDAQNKEEQNKYIDSIGELFAEVEREGGIVPRFDIKPNETQDKVDLTIKDMQAFTFNLVKNEMGLGNIIESYIKKLDEQDDMKKKTTGTNGSDLSSLSSSLVTSFDAEQEKNDELAEQWEANLRQNISEQANEMFDMIGGDNDVSG